MWIFNGRSRISGTSTILMEKIVTGWIVKCLARAAVTPMENQDGRIVSRDFDQVMYNAANIAKQMLLAIVSNIPTRLYYSF